MTHTYSDNYATPLEKKNYLYMRIS